jgi:hypothetical protein
MTFSNRVALIGFSLLLAGSSMAAAPLTSMYTKSEIHQAVKDKPTRTETSETWIKGGKVRTTIGKMVDVIDGQNKYRFMPDDKQKRYLMAPVPPVLKKTSTTQLLNTIFELPPNWSKKKIGSVKLLNHSADIYQITPPGVKDDKNSYRKVWLCTDLGAPVPLKEVVKMGDITVTTVMTRLDVNPKISDSMFAVPKGFHKIELPKINLQTNGKAPLKAAPKSKK